MPAAMTPLHQATASTPGDSFLTQIAVPGHEFISDVPLALGGQDTAPSPMALLTAALAACTTMTVRSYASRKGWPLESASAAVEHLGKDAEQPEHFSLALSLQGKLTPEQAESLEAIAHKCPVHKVLSGSIEVRIVRD